MNRKKPFEYPLKSLPALALPLLVDTLTSEVSDVSPRRTTGTRRMFTSPLMMGSFTVYLLYSNLITGATKEQV